MAQRSALHTPPRAHLDSGQHHDMALKGCAACASRIAAAAACAAKPCGCRDFLHAHCG
jgi:hypothetical protein